MNELLLQGVSVLELTTTKVGSYASMLLASEGAAVYKMEDQNLDEFYDERKCVIPKKEKLPHRRWDIILLDDGVDPHMRQQIATCDAIIVKVHCNRSIPPNELALQAVAGWNDITGCPRQEGLAVGGYPASSLCGAHVAFIALAGLFEKEVDEQRKIEVDCLTILLSALEGGTTKFKATGEVLKRVGNRHRTLTPMCILPSADGHVFVGAPVDEQWALLTSWAGIEMDARFEKAEGRQQFTAELERMLSAWTKDKTTEELVSTGQAFRLPFSKVQTIKDIQYCEQLHERDYFKRRKPWQIAVWPMSSQIERKNRFEQLTILDLTAMWAGPYCTRLFADLGAQVIKVEAPNRPDGIRGIGDAMGAFFQELNRNKKGVTLNLQDAKARAHFLQLVEKADVIVENFSPRVMNNFGFTEETLKKSNEALIFLSMSAFGQSGPYKNYVGYGPTIEAMSGLAALTTYDETPWLPGFSISDIAAGVHGAVVLMSALLFKQHQQGFVRLDLSQYEVAVQLLGECIWQRKKESIQQSMRPFTFLEAMTYEGQERFYESQHWPVLSGPAPKLGQHNAWLYEEGYYV